MATHPHTMSYLIKRRQKAKDYLGSVCSSCGTDDNLEFDHIDRDTKIINISDAIAAHWSWIRLVEELDKCQLLCHTCHITKSSIESRIISHGYWMYRKWGCRCEVCIIDFRQMDAKYKKKDF